MAFGLLVPGPGLLEPRNRFGEIARSIRQIASPLEVRLFVRQAVVEQRGAHAFGDAGLAGFKVEQSELTILPVAGVDGEAVLPVAGGEVVGAASQEAGDIEISAAVERSVVPGEPTSRPAGSVEVRGIDGGTLTDLRSLSALYSVTPGHLRQPSGWTSTLG
jgi:hypothetical protein